MNAKVVTITPEQAQRMLDRDAKFYEEHPEHRPRHIRKDTVGKYVSDMAGDRWKLNAETIKIGPGHRVMDGKHRLTACVQAGVPFRTMMAHDVPHDVFDTIDIGAVRTAADLGTIAGIPNAGVVTHAARIVYAWEKADCQFPVARVRLSRPTKPEVMETVGRHTALVQAAQNNPFHRAGAILSAGVATALLYIFGLRDKLAADVFFEALANGSHLNEDDPVYALRERLIRSRGQKPGLTEQSVIELVVRAWNHSRRGTKLAKLQRGRNEDRATTYLSAN